MLSAPILKRGCPQEEACPAGRGVAAGDGVVTLVALGVVHGGGAGDDAVTGVGELGDLGDLVDLVPSRDTTLALVLVLGDGVEVDVVDVVDVVELAVVVDVDNLTSKICLVLVIPVRSEL